MFFLQIPGETKLLNDYGVLGIFSVIFIGTIIILARFIKKIIDERQKQSKEQYEEVKKQHELLDAKFNKYMDEDREFMLEVIQNNTKAINDFLNHKN